ncbi:hypothetical protein Acife_1014 [Acidithiobacillus ferrivorans SS3]|uniref:Uncharacterized protein n=1 Tax=Acidithiobacillus ferrivorans SS3 TaxID=743299 RepID=G0JNF4_9PROT|nr:hypothetical protein [Acidithiobacillus ferrivorans]AEM47184.1 hypothetical protein Acife_1014 [Acidithiobacillus ferrivorans SS3]MBU2765151.1 hypothetical protein [Acidithiobacillus ferrivorans]MBU2849594.1 hypothetical protein [Acidithiobacillus ferrivorans]OFA15372.1 hypothetical protein A4U49_13575 [Acidithiobacillus ferrivorans]
MKQQASVSVSADNPLFWFFWPPLTVRGIATLPFLLAALIAFAKVMIFLVWFFTIYVFFDGACSFSGLVSTHVGNSLNHLLIGIGKSNRIVTAILSYRGWSGVRQGEM